MFSDRVFGRLIPSKPFGHSAVACVLALGVNLAACGSDKKTEETTATTATTTTTSDANTTTATNYTVVNSDATGTEPTIATKSDVVSTPATGTAVPMAYVTMTDNPNASNLLRSQGVTAYDYDVCTFGFNHGYKVFPVGKFNFAGFYLVNVTPGAALAVGTYTAGTSGMYIDLTNSGAGYSISSCKAASYPTVASGTVEVTALATATTGMTGTLNVTMSDGSVFSGAFTTPTTSATCKAGTNNTQPTPASPDPYACSSLN